ncbi:MAG: pyridoxamine 5'-phosphate oxidase family protein, partial [Reyranella sp.]|nr:pyridoxamine 5'-phosphate oxidase family protein [Reyranella sp.]
VRVVDSRTVMLPDRRGNNRIDSLHNIVRDPRIALLFLIPGVGRTLRINGRAAISINADLCASFTLEGKVPRSVIVVTAESVYTQCPKALVRSRLWDPSLHLDESSLPSSGTIMKSLQAGFDGDTYDRDYPRHLKETIY